MTVPPFRIERSPVWPREVDDAADWYEAAVNEVTALLARDDEPRAELHDAMACARTAHLVFEARRKEWEGRQP